MCKFQDRSAEAKYELDFVEPVVYAMDRTQDLQIKDPKRRQMYGMGMHEIPAKLGLEDTILAKIFPVEGMADEKTEEVISWRVQVESQPSGEG